MTGNNHKPNCGCGWCIGGWRGFGERGPKSARPFSDSFTIPNARCPVCKASVFFYQSPHGGRVFFDDLGPPWPKHPCTDNSDRVYQPVRVNDARRSEAKRVNPQWKQDGWVPIRIAEIITGTNWMMNKFLFLDDKFYSFRALQVRSDIRVGTPALVKDLDRYGVGRIAWLSDANDALTTAEARMFHRAFTRAEPEALNGAVSGNAADTLAVGIALSFGWASENSDGSFSYPPYLNWAIADAWLARAKSLGALEADEWLRACRKMYSPKKLVKEPIGGKSRRRRR